jgi:multiple sugar transport system substrate-binding protein
VTGRRRARLKGWGAVALGLVLCLLAPACSAQDWGIQTSSGNKIHLTYALWDPHEQIGYQQSIDVFEKLHPDISVTIENIPYNSYQSKITAEYISGNAPDVFWVNTPWLADWVTGGLLENITPLVKAAHIDLSQYYPSLVALHSHDGQLYGLPKDWDTIALYYSRAYFAKHHIVVPSSLTWRPDGSGTFTTLLKELTVDTSGRNATQPGFNPAQVATYATALDNDAQEDYLDYFAMNGGSLLPRPYATKSTLASPANEAALNYMARVLQRDHVVIPNGQTGADAEGSNDLTLFSEGKIAMYEAGDWNTTALSQLNGLKLGVLPLPAGPDGRISVFNGLCDGIASNSAHKAAAWQLVQWLASAASQRILGSGGYVWPAIESLDPLFVHYWAKQGINMEPFLAEAHGKTVNFPVGVGIGEGLNDLNTSLGPVFLGSGPVTAGLAGAAKILDYRLSGS